MKNRHHHPEVVFLMEPPYERLVPVDLSSSVTPEGGGWVMVWDLGIDGWPRGEEAVVSRPAGVALALILPDGDERMAITRILRSIEQSRPQVILPYHESPRPREIICVIRRPPSSLSSSVTEYLTWRGFSLDPVTRSIIRRTVDLSANVQTITALAKNLYMSRRALGRRFLNNGLPVPSHWLHVARILRAAIKLQNSDTSLFNVACSLGYPDGFSLSNQMNRLCGIRPLEVRSKLGWEWVFETWLVRETERGNISPDIVGSRSSIASMQTAALGEDEQDPPLAVISI